MTNLSEKHNLCFECRFMKKKKKISGSQLAWEFSIRRDICPLLRKNWIAWLITWSFGALQIGLRRDKIMKLQQWVSYETSLLALFNRVFVSGRIIPWSIIICLNSYIISSSRVLEVRKFQEVSGSLTLVTDPPQTYIVWFWVRIRVRISYSQSPPLWSAVVDLHINCANDYLE